MMWVLLMVWLLLVAASLPLVLQLLIPPIPPDDHHGSPGCVLVLGGGRRWRASTKEVVLSGASTSRLDVGLALARREKLPLLLSGGAVGRLSGKGEAELMAELALPRIGGGLSVWQETESLNTWENAKNCAALLRGKGISRVYVVTDSVHLCRAVLCLQKQGISALPHAADLLPGPLWLPHVRALVLWFRLVYEWLALGWYAVRKRV
jgi:uncharacterized SAM-binding protein YcdF (DUF218 family)